MDQITCTRYTHQNDVYWYLIALSPLGHSLSRCIPGTSTHWETGCVTLCLWLCSCSPSDSAVLAGWSILQSIVCRAFAGLRTASDIRNNRGYIIAEYVLSNRRPMLKNRKLMGL